MIILVVFVFTMGLGLSTSDNEIIIPKTNMLFDFTTMKTVANWTEISDTVRRVGKSKGTLVLQTTPEFQQGIFFGLLNPQVNGACFAGIRTRANYNLSGYNNIVINCKSQGDMEHYKIVLRHRSRESDQDPTYEQIFTIPGSDFTSISLPLKDFKPYYRGREVPDQDPLDISNITMFGIQVFGGVYSPFKQKGVSALEIKTIVVS